MPAELFPAAFAGGGMLLWAALRARSRWRFIGWGFGGQVIAVASGLAWGAAEPDGWVWGLVIASIALYSMALIAIGTAGVLLVRDLFQPNETQGGSLLPTPYSSSLANPPWNLPLNTPTVPTIPEVDSARRKRLHQRSR